MADNRVLEAGHDSKSYQYHLLGLAHQKSAITLSNSFNVLPLKNRITMMNKKRTKEIGRTKYLLFIPLALALMIVSNIEYDLLPAFFLGGLFGYAALLRL